MPNALSFLADQAYYDEIKNKLAEYAQLAKDRTLRGEALLTGEPIAEGLRRQMRQPIEQTAMDWVSPIGGFAGTLSHGRNILQHEGNDIGYLKLDDSGNALRIADIDITPSMRNKGIGTDAIKQVQSQAADRGIPVVLSTDAMRGKQAQEMQRNLYERLGFQKNKNLKIDGVKEEYIWIPE